MFHKKKKFNFRGYIQLPRLHHIRVQNDKRAEAAAEQLIQSSRLKAEFFVMSALSAILSVVGILLDNTAILIGAMVLAPLLNPVLAFSAGVFLLHRGLIVYALESFFGGLLFVLATSALVIKIFLLTGHTFDLSPVLLRFQEYNSYLLLAAFISGFAGVYSWLRPLNNLNLVGVAIAVSLIPFVSFLGMLIGVGEFESLQILTPSFLLNLLLIIFGALVAYLVLGFSRIRKDIDISIRHSEK